ncbi:MAG: hypothetical protein R3C28_02925 [Pirellulaceae bacterium]
MRFLILFTCFALVVSANHATATESIPLSEQITLEFATQEQAGQTLGKSDSFTSNQQPLERQIRLQAEKPISEAQLLEFASRQALDWNDEDRQKIREAVQPLLVNLKRLDHLLPAQVGLIKTTGKEEGGAGYCRSNFIILPTKTINQPTPAVTRILAHELFHILSQHRPDLRRPLYRIIGFVPIEPVDLPQALAARRITNPDAIELNYVLPLHIQRKAAPTAVLPITFSRRANYEGGSLFAYLDFQLLVLTKVDDTWVVLMAGGDPVLREPDAVAEFQRAIGRNTSYIIHPEEIMADNFVHWMLGKQDVPDLWIIQQLEKTLLEPPPKLMARFPKHHFARESGRYVPISRLCMMRRKRISGTRPNACADYTGRAVKIRHHLEFVLYFQTSPGGQGSTQYSIANLHQYE